MGSNLNHIQALSSNWNPLVARTNILAVCLLRRDQNLKYDIHGGCFWTHCLSLFPHSRFSKRIRRRERGWHHTGRNNDSGS